MGRRRGRRGRGGSRIMSANDDDDDMSNAAVEETPPESVVASGSSSTEFVAAAEENDDDDKQHSEDGSNDFIPPPPVSALSRRGSGVGGRQRGRSVISSSGSVKKNPEEVPSMGDLAFVVEAIPDVMRGVIRCAGCTLSEFTKDEESPEIVKEIENAQKEYLDLAGELTKLEEKIRVIPSAVKTAYEDLDIEKLAGEEVNDEQFFSLLEQFEEASRVEVEKQCGLIGMKEVAKNPTYRQFLNEMKKYPKEGAVGATTTTVGNSFSEGLELLTEYVPTTDPFTRKVLSNPVVNRKCNHVYEEGTITGMIITGSRSKTRCPYAGCTNKEPIKLEHLMKDPDLALKIAEKIKNGEE